MSQGPMWARGDVPTYLFLCEIFEIFGSGLEKMFMVFLSSSCRETAKNAIKQIEGKKTQEKSFISLNCFVKVFDMEFSHFLCGVFELPLLRTVQKHHKKSRGERNKERHLPAPTVAFNRHNFM
jgi:hypothetical protein